MMKTLLNPKTTREALRLMWNSMKCYFIVRIMFWKFPKEINLDTGKIKWNKEYKWSW